MMGFRSFLAGTILYSWARLRVKERPSPSHWLSAFVLGTLLFTAGHGTLAWSEQFIPSGIAALICATSPIWITLLQAVMREGNPITKRVTFGLVLGFFAVILLVEPSQLLSETTVNPTGAVVLLMGTFSWSVGVVFSKKAPLPKNSMLAAGMYLLTGGGGLLFASLLSGETVELASVSIHSLISLVYLIVFGSIITFTAYLWLLRATSPSQVATHSYVNPVVAIFVGWLAAGESLTPRILAAASLMVIGVAAIVAQKQPRLFHAAKRKSTAKGSFITLLSGKLVRQKEEI